MQHRVEDVATWARLVTDLRLKSVTQDHISSLLGYSGDDGPRDLDNFAKGRSFTMTIPEGIDVLRRYLRQVEISQEAALQRKRTAEAQDALTPKAPVDQRPIGNFRIMEAAGDDESSDTTDDESDAAKEFHVLVDALKATGTNKGECAALLGYAKTNPGKSLQSVVDGKCKKYTLAQAIAVLKKALKAKRAQQAGAAAEDEWSDTTDDDSDAAKEFYVLVDALEAAGIDNGDCAALLGYAKTNPGKSFESVVDGKSKKCTLAQAIAVLKKALRVKSRAQQAGDASKEFYALVKALEEAGTTATECAVLLGYAGNPGQNLQSVADGKCKMYTLPQAIAKLKAALKKAMSHARQSAASGDDDSDASEL